MRGTGAQAWRSFLSKSPSAEAFPLPKANIDIPIFVKRVRLWAGASGSGLLGGLLRKQDWTFKPYKP